MKIKTKPVLAFLSLAVGLAGWLLLSKQEEPHGTLFSMGAQSGRVALYRDYNANNASMQVKHGDSTYTINNVSYVKSAIPQPFYIDLGQNKADVTLEFSEEQSNAPHIKNLPKVAPLEAGTYENTNDNIKYSGAWIIQDRKGPSGHSVHTAIEKESAVEFEFIGTALEIGLVKYDDRSMAELCIDAECRNIPLYSDALIWQDSYLWAGLKEGQHSARLRLLKGKAADLDWVSIFDKPSVVNATNAAQWMDALIVSNGWVKSRDNPKDIFLRSPRGYAKMALYASGKEITFTFKTSLDGADTEICINKNCKDYDLMSFEPDVQDISLPLRRGVDNVITIRKKDGRYVILKDIVVK